jgi:hypothetical protein
MQVTDSFFYYFQVKNKPYIHWTYAFIREFSTVKNSQFQQLMILISVILYVFCNNAVWDTSDL